MKIGHLNMVTNLQKKKGHFGPQMILDTLFSHSNDTLITGYTTMTGKQHN